MTRSPLALCALILVPLAPVAAVLLSTFEDPVRGAQKPAAPAIPSIQHRIETNAAGERTLIEEVRIHAPLSAVWAAYTTNAGMQAWAAPVVEVDLRAGGTIQSNYNPQSKIGDPGTNTLHIVNWVPERLLTLRADLADNWPEVMKKDANRLMNIVLFTALEPNLTRIESFGVGYGSDAEYDQLLAFFAEANAGLYGTLIKTLEAKPASEE